MVLVGFHDLPEFVVAFGILAGRATLCLFPSFLWAAGGTCFNGDGPMQFYNGQDQMVPMPRECLHQLLRARQLSLATG